VKMKKKGAMRKLLYLIVLLSKREGIKGVNENSASLTQFKM